MTCPACGWNMSRELYGISYCLSPSCGCWADQQDNGRWMVHLPSNVVPFRGTLDHPTT